MSMGRRIAREIKNGIESDRLDILITWSFHFYIFL
jgi:5-formaminoimidazole-4-carboxamide-1-beta-D-ribofuranosyl 5'-monophosphate synthetase